MPYTLSKLLGQMLDKALFALNDNEGPSRAQDVLREVMTFTSSLQHTDEAPDVIYQKGAAALLQTLLVRAIERKDGNRAMEFVRKRKHVRDILHIIAVADAPVLPGEIASRLDIQPSALTSLLREAEELGLLAKVSGIGDGRSRPRVLTRAGRAALTAARPDWAIVDAPRRQSLLEAHVERHQIRGAGMQLQNSPLRIADTFGSVPIAEPWLHIEPVATHLVGNVLDRVLVVGTSPSFVVHGYRQAGLDSFSLDPVLASRPPGSRASRKLLRNKPASRESGERTDAL